MLSVEEVSAAANNYTNIPDDNVDMPDRVLWWTLRSVYEDFRRGVLQKDAAMQMKRDAIQQHLKDSGQLSMFRAAVMDQAEQWSRIEQAADAYAKSKTGRTPEGDALFTALYGPVLREEGGND